MILVLGGAGYIGSHMLKLLRETGESHLVFDNFEEGHREALLGSPYVQGDLRNRDDLRKLFADHPDIDVVMHFAAYIAVGESVEQPGKYFTNNTTAVIGLLEEMRAAGIGKFVFSSTAAIFGEPHYVPIDEAHPKDPTSPYGDSKLMVERILKAFDVAHGFKSVCLRYFNAAGADPENRIGEDHHPETHLIPVAILAAMGKKPSLKVFGTDYDTPDGTCVRDYIHVLDLAQAHLLAVKHLRAGGDSRQYNLGNGQGFTVRQVIDAVEHATGLKVPNEEAPRRAGDPAKLIASSDRIRADWGWNPQYGDLKVIVEHAWNWHKTHPEGYA
ncbi:UDP-glucose 4-epimerase GalE [Fimbriimonas ginsengisoli]|uniref:UDP-glucose 4-epimerase n=1 Tax=Fimbriimonas ginsengisoli Gsoil 348 TaxID=661478 RepID=A0A068NVK3_FIMGI|nr:UDP-glucose 4-epimerase GalE [Fimbriimonas ginsengisoli]AIE87407.1 UDP-glucose 4-epimerase [Fimbriimonas ginsengisoli Gsoil 348]